MPKGFYKVTSIGIFEMKQKIVVAVLIVGFIAMSATSIVSADGGFFVPAEYEEMYQPSQRAVIFYDDGIEDLILQTKYEKGAADFAWVVPVPDYPEVDEADAEIFEELYYLTLPTNRHSEFLDHNYQASLPRGGSSGVKLWERKKVGLYDVSILSATDPSALINWLNENGYKFPEAAGEIVDFYIAKDWYFVAMRLEAEEQEAEPANFVIPADKTFMMRLDVEQETQERRVTSEGIELIPEPGPDRTFSKGTTQPIKLRFNTTQIVYPMKITSLNPGDTEVLLYVFADGVAGVDNFSMEYADWLHTKAETYKRGYILYPEKVNYGHRGAFSGSKDPLNYSITRELLNYSTMLSRETGNRTFTVEYADWIDQRNVKDSEALKEILTKPYFLTKMRCSFSPDEMTHDLVISINSSRYNPHFVKRYYTVRDDETQKRPVHVWPHTSQRYYIRP